MVTYGGGAEGGEAGPPLPGPGRSRRGVQGQHGLQSRGEAARQRVPLAGEGDAGEVWRRSGRWLWGSGQVQRNMGEGGVGVGVGGGDAHRHATASATVGGGLQTVGGNRCEKPTGGKHNHNVS